MLAQVEAQLFFLVGDPESHRDPENREPGSFRAGAGDQGRCDDGKHHLESQEAQMRNRSCMVGIGLGTNAAESQPAEVSNESADVVAEGQRVPPEYPLNTDESNYGLIEERIRQNSPTTVD